MEITPWDEEYSAIQRINGLNPCFNGNYSLRHEKFGVVEIDFVLILVLMEITPWVSANQSKRTFTISLNPCFNGNYSLRPLRKLFQ